MSTAPAVLDRPKTGGQPKIRTPWNVIVWNDPVTLMSYVVLVLQKLFGYDKTKATKLMMQVHTEGKALVMSGPRESAEIACSQLHAFGLQATISQG